MSDSITTTTPQHAHVELLQHLQISQPHAQIALLYFSQEEAQIALARKGVPVHTERFPTLALDALISRCFTAETPNAQELEAAIELIESQLAPACLDLRQYHVFTSGPEAERVLHWIRDVTGTDKHEVSLETVESVFNLYADATVGRCPASAAPIEDKPLGAYLLLLRECMHHLHVAQIHMLCD